MAKVQNCDRLFGPAEIKARARTETNACVLQYHKIRMRSDMSTLAHAKYNVEDGACAVQLNKAHAYWSFENSACKIQCAKRSKSNAQAKKKAHAYCCAATGIWSTGNAIYELQCRIGRIAEQNQGQTQCYARPGACVVEFFSWRMHTAEMPLAHARWRASNRAYVVAYHNWRMRRAVSEMAHAWWLPN